LVDFLGAPPGMIVRAVKCQPFQLAVSPPATFSALEPYCPGDVTEDQRE
jgi:hypothetical protein